MNNHWGPAIDCIICIAFKPAARIVQRSVVEGDPRSGNSSGGGAPVPSGASNPKLFGQPRSATATDAAADLPMANGKIHPMDASVESFSSADPERAFRCGRRQYPSAAS